MTVRICFVSLSAYGYFAENAPAGGGAQRQFYYLSQQLKESFDIHFVVGDYGQPVREQREGVTLHRAYKPQRSAPIWTKPGQAWKLYRAIANADADIYLFRGFPHKLPLIDGMTSIAGGQLVYHVALDTFVDSTLNGLEGLPRRAYLKSLRRVSQIVVQTDRQRESLENLYDISSAVIPNGYPSVPDQSLDSDPEFLLWVGRLDREQKRPHLFLDLAADLPNQEFRLVGPPEKDDEYQEQLERRAESLSNVEYLGRIPPDEIHDYYRRATALVNTSAYEGFPNTFLEAWRCGTPVLSLDVDTGRFLRDDSIGYADGNLDTLQSLVDQVAKSEDTRRQYGLEGKNAFETKYQIETVADRYESLLTDLVYAHL